MNTQKVFFETVKNKLSSNFCLADVVSDVLNVSADSAYRRIRCEKELTLNELAKLCLHFNISMDSVINRQSDNILFKYTPLDLNDMSNYYSYMKNLSDLMEGIARAEEKEVFFRMYLSPVDIMNDFMITKRDGVNVTSIKLYTINGIFTSNDYFCSETKPYFKP